MILGSVDLGPLVAFGVSTLMLSSMGRSWKQLRVNTRTSAGLGKGEEA